MKTLPAGLQTHLDSGATTLCWCWRVARADGEVFGFTDHDRALSFDGTDFEPASGFTPSETEARLGLAVATAELTGALSSARITETDIALGLWDDAAIETWRVNWEDVAERALMDAGTTGEVARGRQAFTVELRGRSHVVSQERGRTYQRQCDAVLGDQRCGVDIEDSAFVGAGTVVSAIDGTVIAASGLGDFAAGWFAQGLLTWLTGDNAGGKIEVRGHTLSSGTATLTLWRKAALAVAPGDTFAIVAGCDKTFATCKAKFDNGINFRGFPHMPGNDFAMSVAKKEGPNDGGPIY